jgi:hypothetical protein
MIDADTDSAQEMARGALPPRHMAIYTHIQTHTGTSTHAHIPMDPTSVLPPVKKTLGAESGRRTLTWTK